MQASHLLKYDSMLGTFKADVKIVDNETISVDGKNIKVVSNRDPLKLPWAELGIDIVIEVSVLSKAPMIWWRNRARMYKWYMVMIREQECLLMGQEQGSIFKLEPRK